jgi:transglutaminase-like putative cysteine protease
MTKANEFELNFPDELALVKSVYEFVRDEIKHSWDARDKRVTKSATEVLEQGVGICWAKANLLAALLRACGIPTGICYQRLTLGDVPETGFCIHALNAVYIKSLDKWIRLDARGNKTGVDAQFDIGQERLAFPVRKDFGEVDYGIVYANPSDKLMKVLEENTDALYMYLNCLPDSIFDHKKATIKDIEELGNT